MPLYEYQCKKCHQFFERIRKFSDPTIKKCPDCGGPVEQTITAPAVQFKGSGWYVTDYPKKSSGAPAASGDSGSKTESTDKKESKDKTESTAKKEEKPKAETSSKKTERSSRERKSQ